MKEAEFFDHLPQTVFAVDAEGLIIRINRTAPSMFGYEKTDALLGMALETLFSPPDRERIGVMLAKARDGLQVPEQEFTGLRKDGSLFPAALFVNGGPSGSGWVCGIVCSLEAARRYQRRVLQEAKMEAVMTLAGGIAHDFNNLLMGIQGYVSLMMADLRKGHPHYRRLLGIERQIQTGSELTNQLLGFARMGQYNRTKTDLNALLAQVVSLFRRRKKGLRMAVTYGEGLWSVAADQEQVRRMFGEILANAWQAMPGGGTITVATENVVIAPDAEIPFAVSPGRYVKVSLADNGVGMDEETRERVFEPFFTTKAMGRGTGLGLAAVYGIVKGHGGFIQVFSEKGKGTRFDVYLPAGGEEASAPAPPESGERRGRPLVLIVDDEKVVLDVMQEMLELNGIDVLAVTGGKAAVDIYRKRHDEIDLVILDMIMPEMDGAETFYRLKEIDADVKVILSSGYSLSERAREIMEQGCAGFLQKPFRMEELVAVIARVIAVPRD